MDKLDEAIFGLRREMDAIEAQIQMLQAQRDAIMMRFNIMQEAASLRPSLNADKAISVPDPTRKSGRQPGAISKKWRGVLIESSGRDPGGTGLPLEDICEIAKRNGINSSPSGVRDRLRQFRDKYGYLDEITEGRFKVTREALDKFRMSDLLGADELSDDEIADEGDEPVINQEVEPPQTA